LSLTQLAKKHGISKTAVLGLLRSAGVTIRHQPLTSDQVAEAIRLYQSGWSMARIADRIGRDDSLVHKTLHRAGVPTRDPHGRER
jgi:DNA-directed RNA polymerase specialized sigma24 family protein